VEERVVRVETEVIGFDRRLGRLEDAVKDVRAEVRDVRADVKEFRSEVNGRLLSLESKMDRQFNWLVGLMFSALVAVVISFVRH
jgi:hypothetical protein